MLVHEHPARAKSWMMEEVKKLMNTEGVTVYEADQCMYGLKTRGAHKGVMVPAKKPTKFMTNSRALGRELSRKCKGLHAHQSLVGGRASDAVSG